MTPEETRHYARGYNAGRRNYWPEILPRPLPIPAVQMLVDAAKKIRDGVDTELAQLGPAVVQSAVDGNRLLLANTPALLAAMRTDSANPAPANNAQFVGVFRHGRERARFTRWMDRIGQPTYVAPAQGQDRQPQFLGDVVGSLSQTLRNVTEQSVTTADAGDRLNQIIVYRMQ